MYQVQSLHKLGRLMAESAPSGKIGQPQCQVTHGDICFQPNVHWQPHLNRIEATRCIIKIIYIICIIKMHYLPQI